MVQAESCAADHLLLKKISAETLATCQKTIVVEPRIRLLRREPFWPPRGEGIRGGPLPLSPSAHQVPRQPLHLARPSTKR